MKITLEEHAETEIETEVLPCPYCGEPHLRIVKELCYQVFCRQCGAKGFMTHSWITAVEVWNKVAKQVDLKDALKNLVQFR